jgi:hypothetical protein
MGTTTLASYNTIGITLTSGGTYLSPFTITQAGTIVTGSGTSGVYGALTSPSLLNEGLINGGFDGVNFIAGGTVNNSLTTATISGGSNAVFINSSYGVVLNDGILTGATFEGVFLADGGAVTNAGSPAYIFGEETGVDINNSAGTVTNFGKITGGKFDGVFLGAGGSVTNEANASIYGYNTGVDVGTLATTVTNFGTISGAKFDGVFLDAGGYVSNTSLSATISGNTGININENYATVTNSGTVIGTGNDGMYLTGGGDVRNTGKLADISGFTGVDLNGQGIVVNAGTIAGNGGYGVFLGGGGTVVNAGTISGNQTAVSFGAFGDDRLAVDPGAVFVGAVDAGLSANYNVLELGAGAGQSTLQGIGTSFTGFNTIAFDGGADWLVSGDVEGFDGNSVSGFAIVDTLDVTDLDFTGPSTVTADSNGVIAILESGGGTFDLTFSSAYNDDAFTLTSGGGAGTDITESPGYTYSNIYGLYDPGAWPSGYEFGQLFPTGINDAGEVVGDYQDIPNGDGFVNAGFIFADGRYTSFGPTIVSGTTVSGYYPAAVNDAGEIAGYLIRMDGLRIPFTYEAGTLSTFGTINISGSFGNFYATGINESGAVAGHYNGYSTAAFADEDTAFLYEGGTFTSLANPAAEDQDLTITGINDSNEIVGWFFDALTNTEQGLIYNDGTYTTLSGPGPDEGVEAMAINDSGEVVGIDYTPAGFDETAKGFIYNDDSYTTLTGPPGAAEVVPVAINNSGEVAGYYALGPLSGNETEYGFVYQNGTYTTIADPTGTNGSAGVVVNDIVTGLNSAGDVIGYYAVAGTEYGFVAGPACFAAGTHIRTPSGDVAVETLKAGDLVTLRDGRSAPIIWLGIRTISTRFADPLRVLPIRIKAGALADGLPKRDLLTSPDHAILIDRLLIQTGALVNGVSIIQETQMPEIFTYYHVEVAEHSLIFAEDVLAETFVDAVDPLAFDNWAQHEAAHGKSETINAMEYPRAKACRQIPRPVRNRLAARAAAMYGQAQRTAA